MEPGRIVTCKRTESHTKPQEESLNTHRRGTKNGHYSMYSSFVGDEIYIQANARTRTVSKGRELVGSALMEGGTDIPASYRVG